MTEHSEPTLASVTEYLEGAATGWRYNPSGGAFLSREQAIVLRDALHRLAALDDAAHEVDWTDRKMTPAEAAVEPTP